MINIETEYKDKFDMKPKICLPRAYYNQGLIQLSTCRGFFVLVVLYSNQESMKLSINIAK